MFDSICAFPLTADLFTQAIHPNAPLVAVGLSSGHVSTLKLPPVDDVPKFKARRGSNGTDVVETAWRTRRHQGSCRCLAYGVDGRQLYSAGADGIVKAADAESGKVTGKLAIPLDPSSSTRQVDAPTVVHALSPQTLLLATDSGALHLFDLRAPAPSLSDDASGAKTAFTSSKPAQTHRPHTDYVSSLTPLPPSSSSTSGHSKQFLSTGGSTLALTDLRRGVLVKSEDQEELLLSSLYVTGLAAKKSSGSTGEKALVGGGDGVITLWEKGQWDDQDERIMVSTDKETLDVIASLPDVFGKVVAVGMGDGKVSFVQLGVNQVVGTVQHDEFDGVAGLGFDVGGRMISGGGQTVKVWEKHEEDEAEEGNGSLAVKRSAGSDVDSDDGDNAESSQEEEKPRTKRKKRKKGKNRGGSGNGLNFAGLD